MPDSELTSFRLSTLENDQENLEKRVRDLEGAAVREKVQHGAIAALGSAIGSALVVIGGLLLFWMKVKGH